MTTVLDASVISGPIWWAVLVLGPAALAWLSLDVFIDGDVAIQTYGADFNTDSTALTLRANAVIQSVAQAQGATYVDLLTPFKGPVGNGDPTALPAADGDHPNQAGHQEIADTLALAGYAPLHTRS